MGRIIKKYFMNFSILLLITLLTPYRGLSATNLVDKENQIYHNKEFVLGLQIDGRSDIQDDKGKIIAQLDAEGKIFDTNGKMMGEIDTDGIIGDATNIIIGEISSNGSVRDEDN